MDPNVAMAAASALTGLGTGVAATFAFRRSERERRHPHPIPPSHPEGVLPAGVDTVLSVLSSSAVVLNADDDVVKASSSAYVIGIVRGGALAVEDLHSMARLTRRDGEIRQAELELPPPRRGVADPLVVSARVAPLGAHLVLLLVEDLTESRRTEAMRRDFVANVSHELKTPVGALSLLAEAVTDACEDPEAVRRFAGRMEMEATRLTNLVQELIDLSRVQDDGPLTEAGPVPVDDLIEEAVDRSRQQAATKQISIDIADEPGLRIRGDRHRLATAFGNLVENAVIYSPVDTSVAIGARSAPNSDGKRVELTVSDQGIGIAERDRERIFERFYRVDQARSRATGGTGLGLSIVKHVVAAHGGDIAVRSEEGQGSTFTVRLPAASRAESSTAPDVLPDAAHAGPAAPARTTPELAPEALP